MFNDASNTGFGASKDLHFSQVNSQGRYSNTLGFFKWVGFKHSNQKVWLHKDSTFTQKKQILQKLVILVHTLADTKILSGYSENLILKKSYEQYSERHWICFDEKRSEQIPALRHSPGGGVLRPKIARYVRRRPAKKAAGAGGRKIRKKASTMGGNKQNQT